MHIGFRWGNLVDLGINGKIILTWFFKKWDGEAWTDLVWLGRGFCNIRGISRLTEELFTVVPSHCVISTHMHALAHVI